jgi:hypothetical protein
MNVWCGLTDDRPITPLIPDVRLTASYLHFPQDELPLSLEDIPLQARLKQWLQHGIASSDFDQVAEYMSW